MTMESLPSILFSTQEPRIISRNLSDVEFLAIKESQGKLRSDSNYANGPGSTAKLTASTGKDMYLARAKCVYHKNGGSSPITNPPAVLLVANDIVVESVYLLFKDDTRQTFEYEFKNVGHKVLAGQVIYAYLGGGAVKTKDVAYVSIECWEENTGESPQIPTIKKT